jgi:hypothetical protein
MHFKSLLHVRDHSKATGRAHHLLSYIAQHVNRHTGEAFDLSVERLADRLDVTPQWVRQLRTRLVETGELIVKMSRGRRPNVYVIPYERCPTCQGGNPNVEFRVDIIPDENNPQVDTSQPETLTVPTRNDDRPNPKLVLPQPESLEASTRNSDRPNPKLPEHLKTVLERVEHRKDFKELKERKEGSTRKSIDGWLDKAERRSPFWCEAHGFCHSERLSDHRPDCWLEH